MTTLTLHMYITDAAAYARGDYEWSFAVFAQKQTVKGWFYVDSFEIEVDDVVRDECVKAGLEDVDRKIEELRAKHEEDLQRLLRIKREIQALPAPDIESSGTG